jgi:hypothetical protein
MIKYENLNSKQKMFVDLCDKHFPGESELSSKQIYSMKGTGYDYEKSFPAWLAKDPENRVKRGVYKIPRASTLVSVPEVKQEIVEQPKVNIGTTDNKAENIIPTKDDTFVPFGHFKDIKNIIKSKVFYPCFITGLSGNGKTFNVQQSCAELNRELIRVNITIETDEDDLLGGFRLSDGKTVWHDGPVIDAMKRGAVLLLDEVDLASNKIMCLQPILEGQGVFLKKINQFVEPQPGFNIVATANTKGKGSEDGRFIGTNILNEAFLERFPVTFEQEYPTKKIEMKILNNVLSVYKLKDENFADKLTSWAEVIRKTFNDGGVNEVIATRRLVHIVNAFAIFKNKLKAVQLCCNRFDDDTKNSFLDLYTKIDAGVSIEELNQESNDSEEEVENF